MKKPLTISRRRTARFAAVQALYQIDLGGLPAEAVIAEFLSHRLGDILETLEDPARSPQVDETWFGIVVKGTVANQDELDPMIEACLMEGWSLARCGFLLRACLRAGAFELEQRSDVPIKVVIDEYVEVGNLFFGGNEPSLINAVLDRLAPKLRQSETAA
ncbi:MAG: transcription antitermination factor NusB [Pseudomonadota bacterium]